jgi:hypothetical protein
MVTLSLIASLLAAAGPCDLVPKTASGPGMISRAVFAGQRLWLRSDDGTLRSLAEGDRALRDEPAGGPVLDVCDRAGTIAALTCADAGWTLAHHTPAGWERLETIKPKPREQLVALSCTGTEVDLLTTDRLMTFGRTPRSVALATPLVGALVTATLATPDALYAGLDRGEWGGGLLRITRTGKIASIDRNDSGKLCGGPLNSKCDPVNGLVNDPWKPGCVIAAIGLVHFRAHGRIVEVCGSKVKTLLEPEPADAFFGLTESGGQLIAVGVRGVYRIAHDRSENVALPKFSDVGDVKVSFAIPGIVLVLTGINRRASISGAVPLLVPR